MFLNIFKNRMLVTFKSKEFLLWALLFPIILSTLFYIAFGKLNTADKMDPITVAVVDDNSSPQITDTLKQIDLISIKDINSDETDDKLKNEDIDGIIFIKNKEISLTVNESSLNSTILKTVLDTIKQRTNTITNIYTINKGNVTADITSPVSNTKSYINENETDSSNANNLSLYFFALIAMTILMGMTTANSSISSLLISTDKIGARVNTSPVNKFTVFSAAVLTSSLSQGTGCIIVLFYVKFILKFNIGDISLKLILLCMLSVLTSVAIGAFIAVAFNLKSTTKDSLTTTFMLISSGLAGLFITGIKFVTEEKFPLIRYINPATLIVDGINSLNYYNDNKMYWIRFMILAAYCFVFFTLSVVLLRRKKYASL